MLEFYHKLVHIQNQIGFLKLIYFTLFSTNLLQREFARWAIEHWNEFPEY